MEPLAPTNGVGGATLPEGGIFLNHAPSRSALAGNDVSLPLKSYADLPPKRPERTLVDSLKSVPVGGHQRPAIRGTVRFLRGLSVETSLEHADERDLIETFVERSRWHCRAARETFSTDEFRPVTTVLASTT